MLSEGSRAEWPSEGRRRHRAGGRRRRGRARHGRPSPASPISLARTGSSSRRPATLSSVSHSPVESGAPRLLSAQAM